MNIAEKFVPSGWQSTARQLQVPGQGAPRASPGGRMNNPLLYQLPGWKIPMIGYVHGNPGTSCSTTRRSLDTNWEMVN